jgi:Cytochrome c554 and c-prime
MTQRRARFLGASLATGLVVMGSAAPQSRVILPHPTSANDSDKPEGWPRARINETCVGCHVEIAAEWKESRHHLAYTNGPFQRSLAREAAQLQPFCQGCHAPEANPLLPPSKLVAEMGIGCVTCHVPRGPILSANESPNAPHGVLKAPEFASDAACAHCHDFLFPGLTGKTGLHMQRTVQEHTQNNAQGQTCADCHMPSTVGSQSHKDHRFPGGYDLSLWQKALDIRAERLTATQIRVLLEPRDVTHAVPTGDLFRRIAVHIIPDKPENNAPSIVYLARHFDRGRTMREVSDNRVYTKTNTLTLDVPPGGIIIRVHYERVANHRSPNERDAEIESTVLLRELQLAP